MKKTNKEQIHKFNKLPIGAKIITLILVAILTPFLLLVYVAFFCITAILAIVAILAALLMTIGYMLTRITLTAVKLTNKLLFRRTNKL